MRVAFALALLVALPALGFSQNTWYVPDDYPTIQRALSSASVVDGDTIIVRPGTYKENLNFLGKAVHLKSAQGPDVTWIDGRTLGSVVVFRTGEGNDSILEGFTLTNGWGTLYDGNRNGGAVFCLSSAPTIKDNIIKDNNLLGGLVSFGGGLAGFDASAIIIGNSITGNTADVGGGVYQKDCTLCIMDNLVHDNFSGGSSGIYCRSSSGIISNNTITANTSELGSGAGIFCTHSDPVITGNVILDNMAGGWGGGIAGANASLEISNNIIARNTAVIGGGGIYSIGFGLDKSIITITNNTIAGNQAGQWGGAIFCRHYTQSFVTNCVLWNNEARTGPEICIYRSTLASKLTIRHSDVMGGEASVYTHPTCTLNWEEGMIDADPGFKNAGSHDYHLSWLSPCINRGENDVAPAVDIEGNPRPYMGTVDMGAYEFIRTHPLEADVFTLSESTGGQVRFSLFGDTPNSGRAYLMLGSVSGNAPGTLMPGGSSVLPVNWDPFTQTVVAFINTPIFDSFFGTLKPDGTAGAIFNTFGPVHGFAGITMDFAYGLMGPWDFVSNPVAIKIVP